MATSSTRIGNMPRGRAEILCPDCPGRSFATRAEFVAHREDAHPPKPHAISGAGDLKTLTAFGTDSEE